MDELIKTPVKLSFNPDDKKTRKKVRTVFENKLARTLWMGIRQRGYLINQYFEAHCLNASRVFEKFGVPDSTEKLKIILEKHFNMIYDTQFIEELQPYLSGKKDLEYEVVK